MPNYEGAPNNLLKEAPKWKHLPSKAIRIPEVYADEVLNFARKLDNNQDTERTLEQSNTLTPANSPRLNHPILSVHPNRVIPSPRLNHPILSVHSD